MRKSFAIPAQVFAHSPKLTLPTGCFEPPGVIEQDFEANVERRHPWLEPRLKPMFLRNESRLLFLPEKPRSSEGRSSDQYAIDSGVSYPANNIVKIVYVTIAE